VKQGRDCPSHFFRQPIGGCQDFQKADELNGPGTVRILSKNQASGFRDPSELILWQGILERRYLQRSAE